MSANIFIGLGVIAIPLAFVWRKLVKVRNEDDQANRALFVEKQLRPPGESLRMKIDQLQEEENDRLMIFVALLIIPGRSIMFSRMGKPFGSSVFSQCSSSPAGSSLKREGLHLELLRKLCPLLPGEEVLDQARDNQDGATGRGRSPQAA